MYVQSFCFCLNFLLPSLSQNFYFYHPQQWWWKPQLLSMKLCTQQNREILPKCFSVDVSTRSFEYSTTRINRTNQARKWQWKLDTKEFPLGKLGHCIAARWAWSMAFPWILLHKQPWVNVLSFLQKCIFIPGRPRRRLWDLVIIY